MKKQALRLISTALILLFFYTAVAKLSNIDRFESELLNQTIPKWSVPILFWLIPVSEMLVAGLLLKETTRRIGFYGSALLMFVFTTYMGLVLLNVFSRVPCSCGGVIKNMGFPAHFVFNLFFLLLSIIGILLLRLKNTR
jgi:putative oxidoreductase